MATWEDVVCKAKELADAAGRKATDVVELTKQKLKLAENERALRDVMEALGQLLYDSRCNEVPLNEELINELLLQAKELEMANEQLQAEIDHYCGRASCSCGAANPQGAVYCNACGKEL